MGNRIIMLAGLTFCILSASKGWAQIPSTLGWYQIPNTKIRPLCPPYPEIQSIEGCTAVMADWSGGLLDTKRNRFIIHGGGHNGYYGNEIYAIDLNATPIVPLLVKDASHGTAISNVSTCPEAFSDGTPNARHTYNGQLYLPNQDAYFLYGAGLSPCGNFSDGQWRFNPNTLAWSQEPTPAAHPTSAQNGSIPQFAYDPTSDKIYELEANTGIFWSYDPAGNSWTQLLPFLPVCGTTNSATIIDPGRRLYMCIGSGQFYSINLNSPYASNNLSGASGCSALVNANSPGFAYDPVQKLEVGWAGGNTVYTYNPDTNSCSTITSYTGGPTTIQANGTFGRFQYSPTSGVFVVVNDIDSNVYSLRLTNGTADTMPPSVPTGLSASALSSSQINLAWTASTDNVGVTGYKIFRGGSQIATTVGTTFSDIGLAASTAYSYAVSAFDAAGNNSAQSTSVSATTLSSPAGGIPSSPGWYPIPNTTIVSYCPDYNVYPVQGTSDCGAVVFDWSSGWNDTKRDRMVMWGGGHGDYHGNEIYTLDVKNGVMARATNPSYPYGNCTDVNPDGTANIRHTYDSMVYVGGAHDFYYQYSGAMNVCGFAGTDFFTLQPDLKTWTATNPTSGTNGYPSGYQGLNADYDPVSDRVYQMDVGSFGYYDPNKGSSANAYTYLSTLTEVDYKQTCGVDSVNRLFVCVGDNHYYKWDLTQANPQQQVLNTSLSGCGASFSVSFPYMTYYPPQKQFVLWAGGNSVYLLDATKNSCTTMTFPNGPPQVNASVGLASKLFGYYPDIDVFALVTNTPTQNAYWLKLTPSSGGDTIPPTVSITAPANGSTVSGTISVAGTAADNVAVSNVQVSVDGGAYSAASGTTNWSFSLNTASLSNGSHILTAKATDSSNNTGTSAVVSVTVNNSTGTITPEQDFANRCAVPGVIVCEGFDNATEFQPNPPNNGTGAYSGFDDSTVEIVQDTTIKASGNGSAHFPIKANDGTGATVRDDNWLQLFCGAHPPAACTPVVFGPNSTFYVQYRYRVDTAYATTNWEDPANGGSSPKIADFAYHNSSCGQTEITTNNRGGMDQPMMYSACGANGFATNPGTTLWNNTTPPYQWQNGYYNCLYPDTPGPSGGCFTMPPNVWMTFSYRIQLGDAGQPNSHITAWVAPAGQPLQTFIDVTNMTMNFDTPGYDAIWFNVYMTNFLATATNPAANAWLDEVIVSSQPIPAPAANSGGAPPPDTTPPTAAITNPANGATVSGTINVTGTAADNVSVANVQVSIDGGAFIAASGTTNWSFSLNTANLANGSHTLTAKAMDTSNNTATSSPISVAISNVPDTTPPSTPANLSAGAASSSQINLSWTASTDNVGVAGYKIFRCQGAGCSPGVQIGTSTSTGYTDATVAPLTGYTYAVSAFDAAGNVSAKSAPASATTPAAPAVAFVQGAASIPSGAGNITLSFPANVKTGDALIVMGTWGSTSGNLACTDSQGDVFAVSAQAVVYDTGNNQALGLCYALNAKGGATTVTINFPSTNFTGAAIHEYSGVATTNALDAAVASSGAGSTATDGVTSGNTTTLTAGDLIFGGAMDDSGAMAAFTAGTGYALREQPTPANSNSMATEDMLQSSAGSVAATFKENQADHYLALLAAFKAVGSTVTVSDTTPPTVAITSPANGTTVSGIISVAGTAADNVSVANVQVSIDGGASNLATGTNNWTFSLNTTALSNAPHTISAKATDNSGNMSTVASITVTVNNAISPPSDTTPPTVSITSPANGSTLSGTVSVSVSASDNVGVMKVGLYLNSTLVATDTATPYGFSWNTKQVANNPYTLTAKAYDAAGNVGTSSPISVTVQNRHSKVQLVASPSLSFTVTALLAGVSSNSNQANFSIEVDTAGEPSFPVAPSIQVTVTMPSGSKSLTLSQLSTNPLVYYAKLPKGQFGSQDFTQLTGTVVTITVGTMTFMADGHNDQVQPALGGTIQDPNGIAAVVVQPGQVSMETQVNITLAAASNSLSNGLMKLNSKAVGSPINIQIISSGTVTATTIVIPFDPTQISSGLTVNQVGLAYQDPVSGNWVLGSNVSLIGNAAAMTVQSGTTFVAALIMPSSIPGLKDALVFPNPAVKTDPTIRAFLGIVNSVEVTIFDVSGHVVNSSSVSEVPTGIINGQYYYDYKWTGHKASGGYAAVVHGKAADGTIVRARIRFVVVQ